MLKRRKMRLVTVDHGLFALHEDEIPQLHTDECLIRVEAIALDRTDVEQAIIAGAPTPGWDLAGTVELAASDGSGPSQGTRIAGFKRSGAWAELAAVPSNALAEISCNTSFAQAATLPIAGLTAMHGLSCDGLLAGQRVFVMQATGSVGLLTVQIAYASGAEVTALIAKAEHEALLEEYGAGRVVVGDVAAARRFGPFDFIVDGVGGLPTEVALSLLSENGTYALYKDNSRRAEPTINSNTLLAERSCFYNATSPVKPKSLPLSIELQRLLSLVKTHTIQPHVEFEASWLDIRTVVQRLEDDDFVGKAVLHVQT